MYTALSKIPKLRYTNVAISFQLIHLSPDNVGIVTSISIEPFSSLDPPGVVPVFPLDQSLTMECVMRGPVERPEDNQLQWFVQGLPVRGISIG